MVLTRQDWRGPRAGWDADSLGYWEVNVENSGQYEFSIRFAPARSSGTAHVRLNGATLQQTYGEGDVELVLGHAPVHAGPGRMEAELASSGQTTGAHYVTIRRL